MLEACLRSCAEHAPEATTTVVYNGAAAKHPLDVERVGVSTLTDYQFPTNQGFAVACNKGAELALEAVDPAWLLFLNDDTELHEGAVDAMVAAGLDLEPDLVGLAMPGPNAAGVVGARLVYPNGALQHAGVYLTVAGGKIVEGHHYQDERDSGPVLAVTGAAMLVRSDLWRALGGFDVGYYNGNEDVDLCLRACAANEVVWYCRDATITHHESASGPERWAKVTENVLRLSDRWAATLSQ